MGRLILDGEDVVYAGASRDGMSDGDQGHVLVADETTAHVRWTTGARSGEVVMVGVQDLVPANTLQTSTSSMVDEYMGVSLGFEVEETYPDDDADEVVSELLAQGEISRASMLAEDVAEWLGSRIRSIGSIKKYAEAHGDTEAFYSSVTRSVLREALTNLEDDDA